LVPTEIEPGALVSRSPPRHLRAIPAGVGAKKTAWPTFRLRKSLNLRLECVQCDEVRIDRRAAVR